MADESRRRGRPPGDLSPEYQEVIALYEQGLPPVEIAARIGKTRAWANSAIQRLRSMGSIAASTAYAYARPPKPVRHRLVLSLGPELVEAIDAARGDASREEWAVTQLTRASSGRDRTRTP